MKKLLAWLLAAALLIGVMPAALAAGAEGLAKIREYSDAGFTDVPDDWSLEGIRTAYEIGLMSGKGPGEFDPNGKVTLAEGAMMAARLHSLWNGGDGVISQDGEHWYDNAVTYCRQQGILAGANYADWDVPATRAQLAGMFCHAVPESALTMINDISSVPDVGPRTPFYAEILTLYRAGVLMGSDEYGTFHPDDPIIRSEIAAIISRIARPNMRMVIQFEECIYLPDLPDLHARFTDRLVVISGIEMPGVIEAGGELFIPANLFMETADIYGISHEAFMTTSNGVDYELDLNISKFRKDYSKSDFYYDYYEVKNVPRIEIRPVEREIGVLKKSNSLLSVCNKGRGVMPLLNGLKERGEEWTCANAIYTLDGHFPLIRLSALLADVPAEGDVVLTETPNNFTIEYIDDVVGEAVRSLIRDDPRETVTAISDYICGQMRASSYVNSCAYKHPSLILTNGGKMGMNDYTAVFNDMCMRAGIPCDYVQGYVALIAARGNYKTYWNRVYVDGQWSYADTWMRDFGQEVGNPYQYNRNYVLADANSMAVDHYWEDSDFPIRGPYDPAWETMSDADIHNSLDFAHRVLGHLNRHEETFSIIVPDGKDAAGDETDSYFGDGVMAAAYLLFGIDVTSVSANFYGFGDIDYVFTVTYSS